MASKKKTGISKPTPLSSPPAPVPPTVAAIKKAAPVGPRKMPEPVPDDLARQLRCASQPTIIDFRKAMMRALKRGDGGSVALYVAAVQELKNQEVRVTRAEVAAAQQ